MVLALFLTRSEESGTLAYASVIHLTPDHPRSAPGLESELVAIRDELRPQWRLKQEGIKKTQKRLNVVFDDYLKRTKSEESANKLAMKLSVEAALHRPWELPWIGFSKFMQGLDTPSTGKFDEFWLYEKQLRAWGAKEDSSFFLSKGMTGRKIESLEEAEVFIKEHYRPQRMAWFNGWYDFWQVAILDVRLPDWKVETERYRGVSFFFLFALFGFVVVLVKPDRLWPVYVVTAILFLQIFVVNFLVGPLNQRYRFVFEVFAPIYICLFLDRLAYAARWIYGKQFRNGSHSEE